MQGELSVLEVGELSLQLSLQAGAAAYLVYVVDESALERTLEDLGEELTSMGIGSSLIRETADDLPRRSGERMHEAVLVDAGAFGVEDWQVLDRRRSELQRNAPMVFVTTQSSLEDLMRTAPHLASWLGADVFRAPDEALLRDAAETQREERLKALRELLGLSDEEVLRQAEEGTLPRDPEYAEWLVLLGRGDLLDA